MRRAGEGAKRLFCRVQGGNECNLSPPESVATSVVGIGSHRPRDREASSWEDEKTASDGSLKGTRKKSQVIEEP